MKNYGICPTCQLEIDNERLQQPVVICQNCGWTENLKEAKSEKAAQKKFVVSSVILGTLLVGAFIHSVNWGQFSFEIVPLKAQQHLGTPAPKTLDRIAEICTLRANPNCVEGAYGQLVTYYPQELEHYPRLGKILAFNRKFPEAIKVFSTYFERGGQDLEAAFVFAKTLGEMKQVENAAKYYRYILDSKPATLQVTVTQSFVELLMKSGRYKEAKKVIESVRKKGTSAEYFMDAKLKEINQILRVSKS